MLPNLSRLKIELRPSDPDDIIRSTFIQLVLSFDVGRLKNWMNTNREFSRIANDESTWRLAFEEILARYPTDVSVIQELRAAMGMKKAWVVLAARIKQCGAFVCGPKVFMKPKDLEFSPAMMDRVTFIGYLHPVMHDFSEDDNGYHPCGRRDGCTNMLRWHTCNTANVVVAQDIPLAPATAPLPNSIDELRRRYEEANESDVCNDAFFKNGFVIQVSDGLKTIDVSLFQPMSMCREETYKMEPMLGEVSCGAGFYLWESSMTVSDEVTEMLQKLHPPDPNDPTDNLASVSSRWWFFIGVDPDEPRPNRLRLRLREFGWWREDNPK